MLSDLVSEILLRPFRVVFQDPTGEASSGEPRSGSRKPGSGTCKPRSTSTSGVVRQAVCIALDIANVEGASSPSCTAFASASRTSLHAVSHASSNTVLRAPLGSLAFAPFSHEDLL